MNETTKLIAEKLLSALEVADAQGCHLAAAYIAEAIRRLHPDIPIPLPRYDDDLATASSHH